MHLKIEFAQASDPGRDPNKQVNEDSCGFVESRFGYLCVLCDGMGGHHGGKEASRLAITTIFEVIEQTPGNVAPVVALKAAIEEAARRVYRLGGAPENRVRPGSTVVAMLLHDGGIDVAHVGDSRAYVIRSNQIYPLTRDHSMVQGMIDAGMLTEEQAMGHPDANKITRALGMKPEVECEVRPEPMELFRGDLLLQASDGLTDLALGADILGAVRQALNSGSVEHACNQLVQLANDRGGHDNITVQMVRVTEAAPRAKATLAEAPAGATPPPSSPQGYADPRGQALPPTVVNTAPGQAPQRPAAPQQAGGWAPVAPTAVGVTQMPSSGVGQTATGEPAASNMSVWTSGQYAAPPGLASYRMDVQQPQLPPTAPYVPHGATQRSASPLALTPMPPSTSAVEGRPSRGGLVFMIVAASAFVAVIIVLVVWALFLH